jgi:hypothetical protein
MNVFANSAATEVEKREKAHSMILALNAIQRELQADIDALTLIRGKGKHRGND